MSPLSFRWDGESMIPLRPKIADDRFVIGSTYFLEEQALPTDATRRHYFACIREAWKNLPEKIMNEFANTESLRKRSLIDSGYFTESTVDAGTHAAALRVAAQTAFLLADKYPVIVTRGPIVVTRIAKSQSKRSMNDREFQKSKEAVLGIISGLIGTDPTALNHNAGQVP